MSEVVADSEVAQKVTEWLDWDKSETTRAEMEAIVKANDVVKLKNILCTRMEFGTAGLRAAMGAGYARMNDLTIIQTTQGFAKYMLDKTPTIKEHGVAIGHDARHNSLRFAHLTAAIFLRCEIPVYLFSKIIPTPFVAYCVLQKHCDWGIMITASHNPKEDNGYKVYYANGAQIISPHDKGISSQIEANLQPWPGSWDTSIVDTSPLIKDPFDEIFSAYMEDLKKLCFSREQNSSTSLKFTYTPMHGVGYPFFAEAMKVFGFAPCITVKEQLDPDPEFPTVKYPNPEEGKIALELSIKTADANGSTVILATDPDADRLALAEKQPDGEWYLMSGNDVGCAVGWWLIKHYQQSHQGDASNAYCLASAVSSRLLEAIAVAEGVNFEETLTGFKWMGNKTCDLINSGKTVLFAFEEAIGFMCGTTVLDKDGISAAVVTAEMTAYLASQGTSVLQHLSHLHDKYGYHVSKNSYFICHDRETIKRLFNRLRNYHGPGKYPESCGKFTVKSVRDLTTGYDSSQPDGKALLPGSKSTQMITFRLTNSCIVTVRTSGTEPKIKYYTEFCSRPEMGLDRETVNAELDEVVRAVIDNYFEPEKNGLIPRKE